MKKAIILGSGFTALGVIRALAFAGIKVIYLSTGKRDFARFSRFVSQSIKAPSPTNESHKLLALLLKTKENWDGAMLLPVDDANVVFVSKNQKALKRRYIPTVQKWDVIKGILFKDSLYRQAQRIGVPTPKVIFIDSVQSLLQVQNHLHYPCILKPYESFKFYSIYREKVFIIYSLEELIEKFTEIQHRRLDVMVSEIIQGSDSELFHYQSYLDNESRVLAEVCIQKLRQHPPHFGRASVSRTVPMIEEIRESALKLLRSFHYCGESQVEFKLDRRDNHYKLMEINVRPVLPELNSVAAGINFPYIAYLDMVENENIPKLSYYVGLYWIQNFFEIREFIRGFVPKKSYIRNFLQPYIQKKVFCVSFSDDPWPFLMACIRCVAMTKWILRN